MTAELTDLETLPFFAALPAAALHRFAAAAAQRSLAAGAFVVRQQEEARHVVVLLSGSVTTLVGTEQGATEWVPGPGEMGLIGWAAFLPPYRHASSVRCDTPCRVLALPGEVFAAAFAEDAALEYEVLARVARAVLDEVAGTCGEPGRMVPDDP